MGVMRSRLLARGNFDDKTEAVEARIKIIDNILQHNNNNDNNNYYNNNENNDIM